MTMLPMTLFRSGGLPLGAWWPLATGIPDWAALQDSEDAAASKLLQAFDETLFSLAEPTLRTAIYNARKDFFQRRKLPSANLETTLHSTANMTELLENLELWKKVQQEKYNAQLIFDQNIASNYQALQAIAQSETLPRALLFASHDLLASLPAFAQKKVDQLDKKDRRTAFSLLQYLTRAVFKTSPLGRLTTVSVKPLIVPQSDGERVGEWRISKPLVCPNVALLPAIYEVLLREPAFFQSLHLSLNPCITAVSGQANWLYFDGEREAFQQIEPNPVADEVVKLLLENQRTMPFQMLVRHLENEVEASMAQLQGLLLQFVDIGLLEWQLPEKGLSAGWCSGLYNYLGYLPSAPVFTEAAYLLQWMRTAARTMPFQQLEEAISLQRETLGEAKAFLEKHKGEMPPIPPEQIFFEDMAQDLDWSLPEGTLEQLTGQLAQCWQQKDFHALPPFRARLVDFAAQFLQEQESIDFLEFSKCFLAYKLPESLDLSGSSRSPRYQGKLGALLQVFQENGEYKAVVNAMYPGGGKMFARWLSLFPAEVAEELKIWHNSAQGASIDFPWQGWSNANFQPTLSDTALAVPDGRVGHLPGGRTILLGDLAVSKNDQGFPQLIEKQSKKPVLFTDLGLEAPETRPPVMQVLWNLGVPFVSAESLLPEGLNWEPAAEYRYRRRVEFQSLVLARAVWELPPEVWGKLFSSKGGQSQAERIGLGLSALKQMGIPRLFFGQFRTQRQKPQFYDQESPISMLLLEKNLEKGAGHFYLTEMLPTPEQWLGDRVAECVVEFEAG